MPKEKRTQIVHLLVEGNGIRGTARLVNCSTHTVTKLLRDIGEACEHYQDKIFRNLNCARIQCDEIWSFVYAKEKTLPRAKSAPPGAGTAWAWIAFDPDSRLVPCWTIGSREIETAKKFIKNLSDRLANRIQLTTDGYKVYADVIEAAFAGNVDYARLVKQYGDLGKEDAGGGRYTGSIKEVITGYPDPTKISTSLVERQNLTMRTFMSRFVRRTCRFSKRLDDHRRMIALHFFHYNFVRIHRTLRISPAMAAGISDRLWSVEDIEGLTN